MRALPPRESEPRDRLEHLLGLAGLALEKAMLYERSQEQARRDSLTGLLAHRPFHEALAALEEQETPFSLVIADIDDFKQINDLDGHPAGDEALREVARILRAESARSTVDLDPAARSSASAAGPAPSTPSRPPSASAAPSRAP